MGSGVGGLGGIGVGVMGVAAGMGRGIGVGGMYRGPSLPSTAAPVLRAPGATAARPYAPAPSTATTVGSVGPPAAYPSSSSAGSRAPPAVAPVNDIAVSERKEQRRL